MLFAYGTRGGQQTPRGLSEYALRRMIKTLHLKTGGGLFLVPARRLLLTSHLVAGSPGNAAFGRVTPTGGSAMWRTIGEELPVLSLWPLFPFYPGAGTGLLN